jgi:hypothetical protein
MKKLLALATVVVLVALSSSCQTAPKKDACCGNCAASK